MGFLALSGFLLANCTQSGTRLSGGLDSKYGVSASPRVIPPGQPIPKGGGTYRVGKPYVVGGRTYYPRENKRYRHVGVASWYGEDFHGRLTANGEIYDMEAISAAHPTLPLPSYARVTNLNNGRSLIVRVNDRGPFHADREIDLSAKAAELLKFRRKGTTRVRVEYVGPASLDGSDDRKLMATLREGAPAPVSRSLFAQASPPPPAPVHRFGSGAPYDSTPAEDRISVAQREESREPGQPVAARRAPAPRMVAETAPLPEPRPQRFEIARAELPEPAPVAAPAPLSRQSRAGGASITAEPLPAPPTVAEGRPRGVPDTRGGDEEADWRPSYTRRTAVPQPQPATREVMEPSLPVAGRGTRDNPRLVWRTGPAPARIESTAAYAPSEQPVSNGRGLY